MAAQTAKQAKRLEAIMKPGCFENSDPVTIPSIMGQVAKARGSNCVLKAWHCPFFASPFLYGQVLIGITNDLEDAETGPKVLCVLAPQNRGTGTHSCMCRSRQLPTQLLRYQ